MIRQLFREHPASVGETYAEHLEFALWGSAYLAKTALILLIHGIVPAIHKTTASTRIAGLNNLIQMRARIAALRED